MHSEDHRLGLARVGGGGPRGSVSTGPTFAVITVGGTNGKGSTVAHLEALLARAPGHAVGLFTSPHFLRYNERIRIDGVRGRAMRRWSRRSSASRRRAAPPP